jgi:tetratricopeptide (TPR) repeat protein
MRENLPPIDLETLSQQTLKNVCYDAAGQLILASSPNTALTSFVRKLSIQEKAHLRLAFYWHKLYKPEENASKLDQIRGYIEAFYHFCQLSAWSAAWQVLQSPLETGKKLYEQFKQWGYYREQVKMYPALLGKLNDRIDCILFHHIGYAYYNLGQKQNARNCYQKQLALAQKIQDKNLEASALGRLGVIEALSDNYDQATTYYQQQLELATLVNDQVLIIEAWENLGLIQIRSADYKQARIFLTKSFMVACEYGVLEVFYRISFHLSHLNVIQGKIAKAIPSLKKQLQFFVINKNTDREISVLTNLSNCYLLEQKIDPALECINRSLAITRENHNYFEQKYVFNSLGIIHAYFLQNHHKALKYFQENLFIASEFNSRHIQSLSYSNISYCYGCLKQTQKAIQYAKKAIVLARKVPNKEAEGAGFSMLGNAYWHSGKRLLGLAIAIRALIILPPWQSANGKLLLRKIGDALLELPLKLLQKMRLN